MTPTAKRTYTVEEYVEIERASDTKYEFVDGVLRAMAGETRTHKRIAGNMYRALYDLGLARGCEVMLEAKVRTKSTRHRYPDLTVSCEPGDDEYFLENPCVLFEVLSDSTTLIDTTEKLEEYLSIPSLQRYVLVEQTTQRVIVYRHSEQGWLVEVLDGSGEIEVPCLETRLSLERVYAGVKFGEDRVAGDAA